MSSPSLDSHYLPHINGLRALAILGVLFYHLRADYCPAGYFGVDLFLIISGFLLLRSLLKPGAEQGFHYGSYLLKKAWRILPSWFVVTLVVCVLTFYLLAPSRAGDILKTARYSALFHADYHIDRSCDYFNVFSQQNPLLHYWYLSITQQIYLLAPLLIIPVARWCSRKAAITLLALLSLLSLAYYILTTSVNLVPDELRYTLLQALGTKTAYYHLAPRFWEFAAGFGVFLLPEFAGRPRLRTTLGLFGLAGVIASFYLYETGSPALYLTVVSSLLALRYASTGIAARLLNLKPLQALGTISFSLYLWHWPVMVFWKYCCLEEAGLWGNLAMLALSLVLAVISWRFVESVKTPTRTGWKGTLLRCSLLLLIPIIAVGTTKMHKKAKNRVVLSGNNTELIMPPVVEQDPAVLRGLESLPGLHMKNSPRRLGVVDKAPCFFLMGDSHAFQLSNSLHLACERAGVSGLYLNNSVLPYQNLLRLANPYDPSVWNRDVAETLLRYLEQQPGITHVIIAQRWESRLRWVEDSDERTGKAIRAEKERMELTSAGLRGWCSSLRAIGKQVILLGDTPTFAPPFPLDEWERYQELRLLQLLRPYRERVLSQEEHNEEQQFSHELLQQLAAEGLALYLDAAPGLLENGAYPARVNGEFLYYDDNHLTPAGSDRAMEHLMPQLLKLLHEASPQTAPANTPEPPTQA